MGGFSLHESNKSRNDHFKNRKIHPLKQSNRFIFNKIKIFSKVLHKKDMNILSFHENYLFLQTESNMAFQKKSE